MLFMQKELCNPNNIVVIEKFMEPEHVKEIAILKKLRNG
jgi:hypothetical protein